MRSTFVSSVVLRNEETSTFWIEKERLGLVLDTVQGLLDEGIVTLMDLTELTKEWIEMLAMSLCESKGDRTLHSNQEKADAGKIAPKTGLRFGVKC